MAAYLGVRVEHRHVGTALGAAVVDDVLREHVEVAVARAALRGQRVGQPPVARRPLLGTRVLRRAPFRRALFRRAELSNQRAPRKGRCLAAGHAGAARQLINRLTRLLGQRRRRR